jgi:hypothetical protein
LLTAGPAQAELCPTCAGPTRINRRLCASHQAQLPPRSGGLRPTRIERIKATIFSFKRQSDPGAGCAAGSALHSDPVTTEPAQGGELPHLTVTGYLIPRVGEGRQPVVTLDQDFIAKQADQTVNDLLNRLPFGNSVQNAMTFAGNSNSPASSVFGLHGQVAAATLVLVDGYRFPSYPIPANDFSVNGTPSETYLPIDEQLAARENRYGGIVNVSYAPTDWLKFYDRFIVQRNEETSTTPNQGFSFLDGIVIPANNPFNPFGEALSPNGQLLREFGPWTSDVISRTLRNVVGANVQLPHDWFVDASFLYGESSYRAVL